MYYYCTRLRIKLEMLSRHRNKHRIIAFFKLTKFSKFFGVQSSVFLRRCTRRVQMLNAKHHIINLDGRCIFLIRFIEIVIIKQLDCIIVSNKMCVKKKKKKRYVSTRCAPAVYKNRRKLDFHFPITYLT